MLQRPYLIAKRLAVFLPGILIAYISVRYTEPYFHKRLPVILAILASYGLAAYVLIPGLIRLWRIIWPPKHLPLYCVTPDGFASDPLNIGLIGNREMVIKAMETAGWHLADRHSPSRVIRHILSVVMGWEYLNAPVSTLYLFGRSQDIAFEMPIKDSSFRRHHVRFWATTYGRNDTPTIDDIEWHHQTVHDEKTELLWVGSASRDIGITPIRHNLQITHMVHPNTNRERELIVEHLRNCNLAKKIYSVKLGDPYKLINRAWRSELRTDGQMTIVWLDQA